jgi:GT2 family glycosyltransferase
MTLPFFSIIIPTYNRAEFLKICIDSVIKQTFEDFEVIIIDDGSEDNTRSIISELDDKRIKYIYQNHCGVSKARNTGIKTASGKFICFLDSDDRFRTEKLSVTYEYIKNHPQYKIFHSEELWYRNGTYLPPKKRHQKPSGYVFAHAVKLCCISISTAAIEREIFEDIGMFDENLPACEDYDFWLRVSSRYPIFLIPHYLTIKEGGHSDQQSKKYPAMDRFRIYSLEKILKSGILKPADYEIARQELIKKCSIYVAGAIKRQNKDAISYYQDIIKKYND